MKPMADPLGVGKQPGLCHWPLTTTSIPGSGRFTIATKSPLIGAWAESNSGGFWDLELKWAGYDSTSRFSAGTPRSMMLV